jgi:uncharacterized protein YrrD
MGPNADFHAVRPRDDVTSGEASSETPVRVGTSVATVQPLRPPTPMTRAQRARPWFGLGPILLASALVVVIILHNLELALGIAAVIAAVVASVVAAVWMRRFSNRARTRPVQLGRRSGRRDRTLSQGSRPVGYRAVTTRVETKTVKETQMADEGQAAVNVAEWHGKVLVDRDGEKIGKLQDVYVDVETDVPQFATVKEGLINRHLTFVPLGGVQIGPDDLQVGVTQEQVRSAPDIEMHGEELSQSDESTLYHHFEMNYTPPETESGRRLARR